MRSIYNRLKLFPFHSILLAIYPVVMLYANNVKEVSADVLLRPLLIALGISVLLLLLVRLVLWSYI
jgi:cytochrome b561